jgi:hypothetical protein
MDGSQASANMLRRYGDGVKIYGIHNSTHWGASDIVECLLTACGIPSYPSLLILEALKEFHHKSPSEAKILLISSSGGAIQVRNALFMASQKVRSRVISLAIAPAAIISKEICYRAHNYASCRDFIPLWAIAKDPLHAGEMIFLKPHPNAPDLDHPISSPTFEEPLMYHIRRHTERSRVIR